MRQAAFYLRVSTKDQTVENQRAALEAVAQARGWVVTAIYQDEGISGGKGREKRPAFDRLLRDAVRAKFDVIMAWDVSRLGRSLVGLVHALDELHACGVDLYLHQQALDTTTPSGKALFQMCGVFAEFERSMISERVKAGLSRARVAGKRLGRPALDLAADIERLRLEGQTYRGIATRLGISVGTVHNALHKLRAE